MTIQVIDRAVRLMRVVAKLGPINLTDISQEMKLPLPTVARISKSLVDNGILQRGNDRKYTLGARLHSLATPLEPFRKSLQVAHPFIEQLSDMCSADCGLAVLQGNEAVIVDWCYGPYLPRIIEPYSREIPLHCAFGKVLIAFQPKQWRARYLKNVKLKSVKLKKMAAGTVLHLDALVEEIEKARQTGMHLSISENVEGAGSLTVPVFDHHSRLFGALFVTDTLDRFDDKKIEHSKIGLFDTANRLSATFRKLGQM